MSNRNKADINVVLTPVTADATWKDGIKFEMRSVQGSGDTLEFHNNEREGFHIRFKIVDDHNTGYRFPNDKDQAMWVTPVNSETAPCPAPGDHWHKFAATGVSENNRTLKVTNLNDGNELFKFALRFTKTPTQNGPCILYDPIGKNRNGPTGRAGFHKLIAAGLAIVAALALAFIAGRASA